MNMASPIATAQEKDPMPQTPKITRRQVRLAAQSCLDEATLQAFLFDAKIPSGRLSGTSLQERILGLLQFVEADDLFEFFIEWMQIERRPCFERALAERQQRATAPETKTETKPDDTAQSAQPVSPAAIRQMLYDFLPASADFDAFLIDFFPTEVRRRFVDTADRQSKHNLLMQLVDRSQIVDALRRRSPIAFARLMGLP